MSRFVEVTPFGARLSLKRSIEAGRLVHLHLTLAMPQKLRCFDHIEDQYRAWSLVRNMKLLECGAAGPAGIPRLHLEFVGGEWPLGSIE